MLLVHTDQWSRSGVSGGRERDRQNQREGCPFIRNTLTPLSASAQSSTTVKKGTIKEDTQSSDLD